MVSKICWNCHFFVADDSGSELGGVCVRNAPKGADFSGFGVANQISWRLDIGHINEDGAVKGGEVLPLHLGGYIGNPPTETPASCPVNNATGLNANDLNPAAIPLDAYSPTGIIVAASRMNTGAASVGATPLLKLQAVSVRGADCLNGWNVDIPIPGGNVGVNGSTTDTFISHTHEFFENGFTGLLGIRVDLTGTTEDEIAEVRNLKLGIVFARRQGGASLTPPTSKAKWATIANGPEQFCGEFKQLIGAIPPIPTP